MKPRLFIGSSSESLSIAHDAQQNLQRSAEVTVWDQGVFQLSVTALESLLHLLPTCDFGMFVFSPDDVISIREKENRVVRDNVIFELGLFVGTLGKERCFLLVPDKASDLHVPTDLIGMTPATFETGRSDGNSQAATGPACLTIGTSIERFGFRPGRAEAPKLGTTDEKHSDQTKLKLESTEGEPCPKCHKRGFQLESSREDPTFGVLGVIRRLYKCSFCGFTEEKQVATK